MSDAGARLGDEEGASTGFRRLMIAGSTILATVIYALDTTIANVALPHIQGSMATTQAVFVSSVAPEAITVIRVVLDPFSLNQAIPSSTKSSSSK